MRWRSRFTREGATKIHQLRATETNNAATPSNNCQPKPIALFRTRGRLPPREWMLLALPPRRKVPCVAQHYLGALMIALLGLGATGTTPTVSKSCEHLVLSWQAKSSPPRGSVTSSSGNQTGQSQ